MLALNKEKISIEKEQDVVFFRQRLKEHAVKIGMSVLNQTKLITAASELVRNMLKYGGGGEITIEVINEKVQVGVRVIFADKGPGIPDISKAMQDGYSTGKSLGLGLPGAKRLVNEFDIKSTVGVGTTVSIVRWKNGF